MLKVILSTLLLFFTFNTFSFADEFDDVDSFESEIVEEEQKEILDPLYYFNKKVYRIYKLSYVYGIKYVAYSVSALPKYSKDKLRNFSNNAKEPSYMINHFLQLRFNAGFESFFRFVINSTIGVLGFWDITTYLGLSAKNNDFGATMYFYGVPSGPYLFLIGPRNLRDTFGLLVSLGTEKYYFPMYLNYKQLDIVYKDSTFMRLSPANLITLAFYSEYYKDNEKTLSGFDEYYIVKTVFTNYRNNELANISKYN